MGTQPRMRITIALTTALLLLAGCESRFTHERFQMVKVGVDHQDDVLELLGEPRVSFADYWYYNEDEQAAQIYFSKTGIVTGKQWGDAEMGVLDGQNPWQNSGGGERESRRSRTYDD